MPPEPTPRKVQKKARTRRGFKAKKALEYGSPPLGNEPDLNAGRRTGWRMARAGKLHDLLAALRATIGVDQNASGSSETSH
jgi:hypothetical protein